ncbi:hypothetical protein DFH09DRAFT_1275247 [Mycena vulgaris]|nr:hypothetical protein DFH09DRAFT_1275247 [Mycena vulgaris]
MRAQFLWLWIKIIVPKDAQTEQHEHVATKWLRPRTRSNFLLGYNPSLKSPSSSRWTEGGVRAGATPGLRSVCTPRNSPQRWFGYWRTSRNSSGRSAMGYRGREVYRKAYGAGVGAGVGVGVGVGAVPGAVPAYCITVLSAASAGVDVDAQEEHMLMGAFVQESHQTHKSESVHSPPLPTRSAEHCAANCNGNLNPKLVSNLGRDEALHKDRLSSADVTSETPFSDRFCVEVWQLSETAEDLPVAPNTICGDFGRVEPYVSALQISHRMALMEGFSDHSTGYFTRKKRKKKSKKKESGKLRTAPDTIWAGCGQYKATICK